MQTELTLKMLLEAKKAIDNETLKSCWIFQIKDEDDFKSLAKLDKPSA